MDIHDSENVRANLERHRLEAQFYEVTLPYMFNLFTQRGMRKKIESAADSVEKGSLALDLGSGTGNIAKYLKALGLNVVAADLSKEMLGGNPVDSRIVCDAHFLPLKESNFTIITTYAFFHHVHGPETVLREMIRVAAPKCVLYFGWDPFLPSALPTSPVIWLATHPKGAIGWLLWLASKPERLTTLMTYLVLYRRAHKNNVNRFQAAESHDVFLAEPSKEFLQLLRKAGFQILQLKSTEMVCIR